MKRFATIFWSVLIALAAIPIIIGIVQQIRTAPSHAVAVATTAPPSRAIILPAAPASTNPDVGEVVVDRTGAPNPDGGARIAIVVGPAGHDAKMDAAFLRLPVALTIIVDPHAAHADATASLAHATGHALYLWASGAPKPMTITAWNTRFGGVAGIASVDASGMAAALHGTGYSYLDQHGDAAATVFTDAGVPLVHRDITVDDREEASYIAYMLNRALTLGINRGEAVVWMRPQAASLAALRKFASAHAHEIVPLVP